MLNNYRQVCITGFLGQKTFFSHQFYSQTLLEAGTATANLEKGKVSTRFTNLPKSHLEAMAAWRAKPDSGSPVCFAASGQELTTRSAAEYQRWYICVMLTQQHAEPLVCAGQLSKHRCFTPNGWRTRGCAGAA